VGLDQAECLPLPDLLSAPGDRRCPFATAQPVTFGCVRGEVVGDHIELVAGPAGAQICRRTWSLIVFGLPPLHFGSKAAKPDSLNTWITRRTYSCEQSSSCAMSGTLCPLRRHQHHDRPPQLHRILAVRPIRCNRCPSVIVTGRTDTSGGRPIITSENSRKQPDRNSAKDQLHEQHSWTRH
jgi:hypothetical protein